MVHINVQAVEVVAGLIIPILVAVLAKEQASSKVKVLLSGLLAGITAVVAFLQQNGGDIEWSALVVNVAQVWVLAVAAYHSGWKPTGVTASVAAATADFGVGSNSP